MARKLSVLWTSTAKDEEEKSKLESMIGAASPVLERLLEIVDNKILTTNNSRIGVEGFDEPGWPYRQADANGYLRALKQIKELIDINGKG